jgi:hypothetical protein
MDSTEDYYRDLLQLDLLLNLIYKPLLLLVGLVGNFFIFYIYKAKYYLKISTGFYYICLALVDTLGLFIIALSHILLILQSGMSFNCDFLWPTTYVLSEFSAWLHVVISFDQLISLNGIRYFSQSFLFQILIIIGLLVILTLINIPNFINFEVVSTNDGFYCDHLRYTDKIIRNQIDLVLSSLLPFFLTTITGIMILTKLIRSKNKVSISAKPSIRKTFKLSITILGINLIYLLLNLPFCILIILNNIEERKLNYEITYDVKIIHRLKLTIGDFFICVNSSCCIFIHLILNKTFREIFKQIFTNKFRNLSGIFMKSS